MKLPRLPIPAVVALGFAVVVGAGLLLGYFLRDVPSDQENCTKLCAKSHRLGQLVPRYPGAVKPPFRCECL